MVREVQLSWDNEHPFPAELEQRKWDLEENALDDHVSLSQTLLKGTHGNLRRKNKIRGGVEKTE